MQLVLIFGPPAVGKMTVGHELARLTGFKLFHNHMTVEPVLDIFPFGSPPFDRLVGEFRTRIIEEAADTGLAGLVFTFVWGLESPGDQRVVDSYVEIVRSRGGQVYFVELAATQAVRLVRNESEFRLEHKRSKRDLAFSRGNLLELDEKHRMNTDADFPGTGLFSDCPHLRIDNTGLSAVDVARRIVEHFSLG